MENQTTPAEELAAAAADAAIAPAWLAAMQDEGRYILSEILNPNGRVFLMDTNTLTKALGATPNALPQLRIKGKGPKFLRMTNMMIRYRSDDVRAWLESIECTSTSDEGGAK